MFFMMLFVFFFRHRPPPDSTRSDTLFPFPTVVRSADEVADALRDLEQMLFVAKLDRGDDQLALAFDIGLVRAVDHDVADVGVGEQLFERTEAEQLVDEHFFERELFAAIERDAQFGEHRSEEHTSELQSLMRISYAVFRLTKK